MVFEWRATVRWIGHGITNLTPPTSYLRSWVSGPQNLIPSGLNLSFEIVDDVVWSVVTALESVVLVSMLGFFFLFCGCTI